MIADLHYLDPVLDEMAARWPDNRIISIVCHGHSVPSGYFATPFVNTFEAYPHRLHRILKERFPFAVLNVIVTGIGGEDAAQGAQRFAGDVLNHKPDVITIDYALNDRRIGLDAARRAWENMICAAQDAGKKVILLTPTWDSSYYTQSEAWEQLKAHREQILELADRYHVGLADSFAQFERNIHTPEDLTQYLSHVNHPSALGHQLVAAEIAKYFPAR